ncbi:MAG: type I-G CRISPR-associated protein, Cas3-extension family [Actinomycetota bacterium]
MRANDVLGFLAAVGLVALSEQGELPPLRLSWEGRSAPVAVIEGSWSTLDELGQELSKVLERLGARGEVAPGLGADFPVPNTGSTTDRMRMPRSEMAQWYERADDEWRARGNPWFARWLVGLAAQAAIKGETRGDVELTPFCAPTGRMTLRGSLFEASMAATQRIGGPGDALVRWRRIAFDGANFDDRATRDGAVTTTGKADNRGAPSPTWLAVMGIRMFTITDDGSATACVGWQRVRLYPGFTYRSLVWPAWTMPLDPAGVRTLLSHPALKLEGPPDDPRLPITGSDRLRALGISAVFGASRRTRSQGDGPLGPARRLWP